MEGDTSATPAGGGVRAPFVRALQHSGRRGRPARSLVLSLAAHASLALALLAYYTTGPPGPQRTLREYHLEVASQDLFELAPELPEEQPELLPLEELEPPELVPQEVSEVLPQPPPDDEPPPRDDSFELIDPLQQVKIVAWPDRVRPRPIEPPPRPVEPAPTPAPPHEYVPVVLEDPAPAYPRVAQRLGLEGSVQLRATVNRDGSVRAVEIIASSGHAILDEAGRDKLLQWRFRPWQPGEPEARTFLKTFRFRLPR